ncbi:hypothetical protein EUGRSUZ_L01958 [Eucalyptus grandis]|uniref:Uncharacterized protein n=1 Tax=Eucalyptus grandis TaxID=71139 RepID=A0A058ZRY0_EUCGR|nr:hypothetical protein EUGRSUZ_L01958 [Eucalyptus grandis]
MKSGLLPMCLEDVDKTTFSEDDSAQPHNAASSILINQATLSRNRIRKKVIPLMIPISPNLESPSAHGKHSFSTFGAPLISIPKASLAL